MLQQFLSRTELTFWPLLALVIFFLAFLGVLAYVIVGGRRRDHFERLASMPLDEDPEAGTNDVERRMTRE